MLVMLLVRNDRSNSVKFRTVMKMYLNSPISMGRRINSKKAVLKCFSLFVENLFYFLKDLLNRNIILKWGNNGGLHIIISVSRLSMLDISMNIRFPTPRKELLTYFTLVQRESWWIWARKSYLRWLQFKNKTIIIKNRK